jgi:hypothetical protein
MAMTHARAHDPATALGSAESRSVVRHGMARSVAEAGAPAHGARDLLIV